MLEEESLGLQSLDSFELENLGIKRLFTRTNLMGSVDLHRTAQVHALVGCQNVQLCFLQLGCKVKVGVLASAPTPAPIPVHRRLARF